MPITTNNDEGAELPEERYQLTEGPLPKSIYTYQLEDVTRKLLMCRDFEFTQENMEDFITIDNTKYNWTEIVKYANFDHIELNTHDFYLYSKFIQTATAAERPNLIKSCETTYRNQLYQDYYFNNKQLPEPLISYQEMQAINMYTGGFYTEINALLRGKLNLKTTEKTLIKEAIIQSVMCASGLRKIPETTIKDAYRAGNMPSLEEHNQRIKSAKEQGVIQLSGFVSSSIDRNAAVTFASTMGNKPVFFHFTNLKGIYVAPIAKKKDEEEFLISPTQVQLIDYKFEHNTHCFEGQLVSDLANVNARSLDMGELPHRPEFTQTNEPILADITSYETLRDQLMYSSPAHCMVICKARKDLISSASDFAGVMEFLSTEQRQAVYDVMNKQNKLAEMIKSVEDVDMVCKYLSQLQSSTVFDAMKSRWPDIIKSIHDFTILRPFLTSDQSTCIFDSMMDKWQDLIESGTDLGSLCSIVTPEQGRIIFDIMKMKLPEIVRSIYDLDNLFGHSAGSDVVALLQLDQFDGEKKKALLLWYINDSKDLPKVKLTALLMIKEGLKRDCDTEIRSIFNKVELKIDNLMEFQRNVWLHDLFANGTLVDNFQFDHLPRYLRQDNKFILALIKRSPSIGTLLLHKFLDEPVSELCLLLSGDREIMLALVKIDGKGLRCASHALTGNTEIALAAIKQNLSAFLYVSPTLRDNKEFMLAAIKIDGMALRYASDALKGNRELVLAAVKKDGMAIQYASDALNQDEEIAFEVLKQLAWQASWLFLNYGGRFSLENIKHVASKPYDVVTKGLMNRLDPVEIMVGMKKALLGIRPQHLTEEQINKIDEHMQVLDEEVKTSNNETVKSRKKEHMDALGEFKTLCQTMDVSSALQQIEADDRFKHIKAGSRTYQLMDEMIGEPRGKCNKPSDR